METIHFMTGAETELTQKLKTLAQDAKAQWFSEENVALISLTGTPEQRLQLRRADALYRSIELSLRFNQERRAVWYLAAYCTLCRQLFSAGALDAARKKLES